MKKDWLFKEIVYKGYTISIFFDSELESPRVWDNLGTVYTVHKRYCPELEFDKNFNIEEVIEDRTFNFKEQFLKKYVALPIYLYDHSGQTIRTTPFNDYFDSGFFGMIAVSLEKVRKEYQWVNVTKKRRATIERYLLAEIKELDNYMTGEVYCYTVENKKGEFLYAIGGFYGDEGLAEIERSCKEYVDSLKKVTKSVTKNNLITLY